MEPKYDLGRISTLLVRGFTDQELRRFCQATPEFRPVYDELSPIMGKAEVASRLLDYAESRVLIGRLLAWAREKNPKRYELHGPYLAGPASDGRSGPEIGSQPPIRLLFLAANPTNTTWLRLGEEVRSIQQALRGSEFRDRFGLQQEWAVRVSDLQRCLLEHRPHVVHFSGHGVPRTGAGSSGLEGGSKAGRIMLEDDQGRSQTVPPEALTNLFGLLKDNIRCVILNACYSEPQARAIAQHIDCVIGMSTTIKDKAAIQFSAAFYRALGYGRDVWTAFVLGCNQLGLQSMDEADAPRLIATRCDPKTVVLVRHGSGS
ncbi:MAG: CHAT domain-containing protein [Anaerolineae bacterium]